MDLYWIKFPKVGSAFAATIIGFACNTRVEVTTEGGIEYPATCNRTRLHQILTPRPIMRWYESPVHWIHGKPIHNVVALFRDPIDRRLSEFLYFHKHFARGAIRCCGFINNVESKQVNLKVISILQTNETLLKKIHSYMRLVTQYQGCMTNMLLGNRCFQGSPDARQVHRAVYMVHKEIAFVGLQNRWNDTVRLWHRKYGGTTYSNEMSNHITNTKSMELVRDETFAYNDVNSKVVEAATLRFDRDYETLMNGLKQSVV